MNYFDLYSSYPDRTIAAAWDSQVKEADNTWLAGTLTECRGELFARFAACYAELRALPRSARRALQRQLARSSDLAVILPEYFQQGGRRLQHRMAWSLAGAALLLALGQGVATAATITVTTNDPRIIPDGQCSLVEAIVNANDDAATHADCPAGSGADTIVLPANAYMLLSNAYVTRYSTSSGITFSGPSFGLPQITSRITIEGNGATIHRDGNAPAFGLIGVRGNFHLPSTPGDLTLQNVTLSGGSGGVSNNGNTSIKNSVISGNKGNGVSNFYGTLTIANSTISGNRAGHGGGVSNSPGYYGGGTLTLNNSLIAGNQAAVAPEIENSGATRSGDGAVVNANNFNLFGVNGNAGVSGFTIGPTDIVPSVSLAQILGPLKNNGGPTQTHALVAGSPAIDAGDPGGCRDGSGALLQTDQRGFPRNVDGNNDGTARCDIGAVEGLGFAAPVDFDGDGKSDLTIYRDGVWFVLRSSNEGGIGITWGGALQDVP